MNKRENIVLFGTSRFAVIVFDELNKNNIIPTLLVTQPDRPQGRKMQTTPTPAKMWAIEHNIPILQPEKLDADFAEKIHSGSYRLAIVASYGTIIPQKILSLFPHGMLNVHPSLLPKYRGASPLQSAILADDKETGVSIIALDEKMDHGPIVAAKRVPLQNWPLSTPELEDVLARAGGNLLAHTIQPWLRGEITPQPQNESKATYTQKLSRSDGELDLSEDAYKNYLKIQALTPWPGTYFWSERGNKKMRIKIVKASFVAGELRIERIVPEGGREMAYTDFLRNS